MPKIEPAARWYVVKESSILRLQVPLALAAGLYEKLTDEELFDHYCDIQAEYIRRGRPLDPA